MQNKTYFRDCTTATERLKHFNNLVGVCVENYPKLFSTDRDDDFQVLFEVVSNVKEALPFLTMASKIRRDPSMEFDGKVWNTGSEALGRACIQLLAYLQFNKVSVASPDTLPDPNNEYRVWDYFGEGEKPTGIFAGALCGMVIDPVQVLSYWPDFILSLYQIFWDMSGDLDDTIWAILDKSSR